MTSAARTEPPRAGDALGQSVPDSVQGEPFAYLAEKCRREFLRRWWDENGKDHAYPVASHAYLPTYDGLYSGDWKHPTVSDHG